MPVLSWPLLLAFAAAAQAPPLVVTVRPPLDPAGAPWIVQLGTPPDVEIRVVSKVIQGEIVDLKNVRVPVAALHVSGFQEPLKVEGGSFTWDKVVDGWMTLHATARGLNEFDSSPFRKIRVSGGWVDPGFLSLEIRPSYVLNGRAVLPSGAYALCGLEYGDFDEGADIPPEACVSGVLPPGGTLLLRLDP